MHFQSVSCLHCRSRRYLDTNNLNGTIPPELGNLSQLQQLYAQMCIARYLTLCIIFDVTLLDTAVIMCEYYAFSIVVIDSLSLSQVPLLE